MHLTNIKTKITDQKFLKNCNGFRTKRTEWLHQAPLKVVVKVPLLKTFRAPIPWCAIFTLKIFYLFGKSVYQFKIW